MKKYILGTILFSVVTGGICIFFDDYFFTKNNARVLVKEQGIMLTGDFTLLDNESSSGIGADYYHTFLLEISAEDAKRAIESIKSSPKFILNPDSVNRMLYMRSEGRYMGPTITQEYEADGWYVREYFKPSDKENYAPTFRRISINKDRKRLVFEDIAE